MGKRSKAKRTKTHKGNPNQTKPRAEHHRLTYHIISYRIASYRIVSYRDIALSLHCLQARQTSASEGSSVRSILILGEKTGRLDPKAKKTRVRDYVKGFKKGRNRNEHNEGIETKRGLY